MLIVITAHELDLKIMTNDASGDACGLQGVRATRVFEFQFTPDEPVAALHGSPSTILSMTCRPPQAQGAIA